jgi:hypothetical protein
MITEKLCREQGKEKRSNNGRVKEREKHRETERKKGKKMKCASD